MRFEDLTYEQTWETASRLSNSSKKKKEDIFAIIMFAQELQIPCIWALNGGMQKVYDNIEISARLMNHLARKHGHDIKTVQLDDNSCTVRCTRGDNGSTDEATFTYEEAKLAGISNNDTWRKYRQDMLFSRALSRVCRRHIPDAIGPCYVLGEISEAEDQKEISKKNEDEQEKRPVQRKIEVEEKKEPEPEQPPRIEYSQEDLQKWANETMPDHKRISQLGEYLNFVQTKMKHDVKLWFSELSRTNPAGVDESMDRWEKQHCGEKKNA